jgi:hypothetical protein
MNKDSTFLLSKNETQSSPSFVHFHSTEDISKNEHQNKKFSSLSTDSSENSFNENINNVDTTTTRTGSLLSLNIRSLKRQPSCAHLCEENKSQSVHHFNKINITPVSFDNEIPSTKNNFALIPHDMCNNCDYFYLNNSKSKQNTKKQTLGLTYKPKGYPKRNLMSSQEIAFDNEITKCIQNQTDYKAIESKFAHLLKL